ncbi:SURF1 family protein [Oxalobacteraceae bacterium]|nr:SURF1 family protein [Oxalobacteraceae bacterium]
MRKTFRFRWIPFIAMLAVVALGIALGNWQRHRAAEKVALEQKLTDGNAAAPVLLDGSVLSPAAAEALEFRRLRLRGSFVADWALYLDNRPYQGRAGFYLLMPFKISGSTTHVLVARGWLPRNMAARATLPAYLTPAGEVEIEGYARRGAGHVMQLGTAPALQAGAIVQNATPAELAAASGLSLQPLVLEQSAPAKAAGAGAGDDTAMVRDWPAPALGVDKHRGYAFQWYALALMAFLFFVVTGFKGNKKSGNESGTASAS